MTELVRFFWERRAEILALTGEHLLLVVAATALAVAIGVPLGVALTRRPRLARPVLGFASVVQTIPSLALFGFLIPLPVHRRDRARAPRSWRSSSTRSCRSCATRTPGSSASTRPSSRRPPASG